MSKLEFEDVGNDVKLERSTRGDEILIFQKNNGQKVGVLTYIALGDDQFKQAALSLDAKGNQSIALKGPAVSSKDIFSAINDVTENKVYWNRRKFKFSEIDLLEEGKSLNNYREITQEYSPMKLISDKKVHFERALRTMNPGTEIQYKKYRGGKEIGTDYFICTGKNEFLKAYKRYAPDEDKMYVFVNNDPLSIEDVIKNLPKNANELSPEKSIDIVQKKSKFSTREIKQMRERNKMLDDTLIEKRREDWIRTDKVYSPIKGENNVFIEHWIEPDTKKVIHSQPVFLDDARTEEIYAKKQVRPTEIDLAKEYVPMNESKGVYAELWKIKGTNKEIIKRKVQLTNEKIAELQKKGLLKGTVRQAGIHRADGDKEHSR